MNKDLICIVCPNGCKLHGELTEDGILTVTGNKCVRGKTFAGTEMTDPTRLLTTTVRTVFKDMPVLPVRTLGEIPKYAIKAALQELSTVVINKRISCGEVIVENLGGTGCSVIATLDL